MRSFFSVFLFALFCFYSISESLPREGLTWEQALSLALEKNPELLSLNQALPVWEGEKLQAGLKPNPELNVNLEGEETSFSLSQALQRLGKRKARVEVSQKLFEQARLKYKSKQNEIACDVYAHFVAVLVSQKLLGLAEESKILSLEVETRVAERVQAGVGGKADEARARLNVFSSELLVRQAKRHFEEACLRLYALWDEDPGDAALTDFDFEKSNLSHFFESWEERLEDAPAIQTQEAELQISKAELESARQEAKTEFTLSGGVKRGEVSGDPEILVGISKPLGLFDRNQGKIQASEAALKKTESEQVRVRRKLRLELSLLAQQIEGLEDQIQALRESLIPEAKRAFQSLEEVYRQGRLSFLEVLSAQTSLFELRKQYWDAVQNYHQKTSEWMKKAGVSPEEALKQGILS